MASPFIKIRSRLVGELDTTKKIQGWFEARGIDYDDFIRMAHRQHPEHGSLFVYGFMIGWEANAERVANDE